MWMKSFALQSLIRQTSMTNLVTTTDKILLVIKRAKTSSSTYSLVPRSAKQLSATPANPLRVAPINEPLDLEPFGQLDHPAQQDLGDLEPWQPPEPVRQELLARIPVEHHGVLADKFNTDTEWLPIYRLPYLLRFRAFIRFKVYFTGCSISYSGYKFVQLLLGDHTLSGASLAGLSAASLVGLAYIGDYFRRIVCQIYVTEDLRFIRICRFTFFGTRRDLVLPVDCVYPLTETNPTSRAPILKLEFRMPENLDLKHDNYEFYEYGLKIAARFGGILDSERFEKVLGHILKHKIGT